MTGLNQTCGLTTRHGYEYCTGGRKGHRQASALARMRPEAAWRAQAERSLAPGIRCQSAPSLALRALRQPHLHRDALVPFPNPAQELELEYYALRRRGKYLRRQKQPGVTPGCFSSGKRSHAIPSHSHSHSGSSWSSFTTTTITITPGGNAIAMPSTSTTISGHVTYPPHAQPSPPLPRLNTTSAMSTSCS